MPVECIISPVADPRQHPAHTARTKAGAFSGASMKKALIQVRSFQSEILT
jgi:hypothetical protein